MGFNAVRMSQQNMERSYAVKLFLVLITCFACVALSGVEARARGCTFVPSGGGESIDAWTTNEDAGLAGFTVIAHAQSGVAQRQAETGITTYYYAYKSNAVGKVNAEKKRGKYARMYYDDTRRKWAVDVSNGLTSSNSQGSERATNETTASNPQTGSYIYYYEYKSNAEGKLKAERNRGKRARMFYDSGRRRWAVEVANDVPGGTNAGRTESQGTTEPGGPGRLPNGATVLYFPNKSMAEGIYKASLRQGDWAKMWYDEKRREWAVAVKPRLGR
jgi:hypothetical protein